MANVEKGEEKLAKIDSITKLLSKKISKYKKPEEELTISYLNAQKLFSEEEDRFLVVCMQHHGYGKWDEIKNEITKSFQFRFDWFLKSRTPSEVQRRCDFLVKQLEKEKGGGGGGKGSKKKAAETDAAKGKQKGSAKKSQPAAKRQKTA